MTEAVQKLVDAAHDVVEAMKVSEEHTVPTLLALAVHALGDVLIAYYGSEDRPTTP